MFWRKIEVKNQKKPLPRLAKVHVLNGVWVCMCGGAEEGVAGSPEGFLVWRLLHVVPRTQFSLSNKEELKAPGPRVVQIHFTRNTTSSVSKYYFRAYKTCFFSLAWFLYRI